MWHIFYRDLYNDDPLWHMYDDYVNAPIFNTKQEAIDYIKSNKEEFEGCVTKVAKEHSSI